MAKRSASYEQLATAFRHGKFGPLYLFYGEERFFVDRLQQLVIEHALAPHEKDFNLDIVYGPETDVAAALALCASYPVMAERRVVIIRDFDRMKENRRFKAYAEQPNPTAVVVLVAGRKVNRGQHPYRAIREHGELVEFQRLYEREVPRWIESLARDRGMTLEPEALRMLAEYLGTNLQSAEGELGKLAAFAGDRTTITGDDVVQASGHTREFNVFELQKAVGSRRMPDALRITERLLQQASNSRGEAIMIVSVLSSFFQKLWILTSCQSRRMSEKAMATRIGVPPYFLGDYISSLRRFNQSALASAFSALVAADYELKGGSHREDRLVLALLLRRLASGTGSPVPAA